MKHEACSSVFNEVHMGKLGEKLNDEKNDFIFNLHYAISLLRQLCNEQERYDGNSYRRI